ncbi:hypothetical protein KZ810_11600 [Sphingomonas sp. RHCKR47]|nr:hypothetical protein [Sphingomonas citricola]
MANMKSATLAVVAALASLAVGGASAAASAGQRDVDGVITRLDLTTFANSVGPRRSPDKTTFADYGFIHVEKTSTGAELVRDDRGWR